jgi:hypothetical protein
MVGAGRERSEAPSSARGGRGTSIPPQTLRRALYDSIGTPEGASSSAKLPTGRGGRGRGRKAPKVTRGGRGRGRKAATPSSPPPPADSPEHRTATVDPSEVEATRTPVHEPRVDDPSVSDAATRETPVPDASSRETPVPDASSYETPHASTGWDTWPDLHQPEPSGHADGGGDQLSDSGDEVAEGATVYHHGCTRFPPVPATREQRWPIRPESLK